MFGKDKGMGALLHGGLFLGRSGHPIVGSTAQQVLRHFMGSSKKEKKKKVNWKELAVLALALYRTIPKRKKRKFRSVLRSRI